MVLSDKQHITDKLNDAGQMLRTRIVDNKLR